MLVTRQVLHACYLNSVTESKLDTLYVFVCVCVCVLAEHSKLRPLHCGCHISRHLRVPAVTHCCAAGHSRKVENVVCVKAILIHSPTEL